MPTCSPGKWAQARSKPPCSDLAAAEPRRGKGGGQEADRHGRKQGEPQGRLNRGAIHRRAYLPYNLPSSLSEGGIAGVRLYIQFGTAKHGALHRHPLKAARFGTRTVKEIMAGAGVRNRRA